jgi:hypothetical protein
MSSQVARIEKGSGKEAAKKSKVGSVPQDKKHTEAGTLPAALDFDAVHERAKSRLNSPGNSLANSSYASTSQQLQR